MDIISFNEAATANGRIEKVIAQPDSVSGLVTMPSTIAVGETVTIPAGRVVVHPNLQIDGTLDIQGDLFIPSGGTSDQLVSKTGDTMTGNLNFSGTGLRITGDFSNATLANRTLIQTNVLNAPTFLDIIPNGTNYGTGYACYNSSDPSNASVIYTYFGNNGTEAKLMASKIGTGAYLPLTFSTGGRERLRIDTSGNVLVTGSGGLGYGAGSGGTVTQLTSKSTAVTLNKPTGTIFMHNASLAAGGSILFIVNSTSHSVYDTVITRVDNNQNYRVEVIGGIDNAFYIKVTNISAVALADSVTILFTIIKGSAN